MSLEFHFVSAVKWKRSNRSRLTFFFPPFIVRFSQGREPAESQLYAEHDWGPDRVGPVILRVPAPPPTANLQIIFSGTVETWSEDMHLCMCVRVCMYMLCVYEWKQWEADSSMSLAPCPAVVHHLTEENLPSWTDVKRHSNQTVWRTVRERTKSDKKSQISCLFRTFQPAEAMRLQEEEEKEIHDDGDDDNDRMNQCLFS